METAMMTIPAKRFTSFRRWQLTWYSSDRGRENVSGALLEMPLWSVSTHRPHFSQIAKVYLTLSASSVPVESMFSLAGLVKNSRRSSVAPHHLNRLCFVHDNYANFFHWNNSTTVVDLWFHHSDSDRLTVIANLCIIKLVLWHLSWEASTVLESSHPSRDNGANLA